MREGRHFSSRPSELRGHARIPEVVRIPPEKIRCPKCTAFILAISIEYGYSGCPWCGYRKERTVVPEVNAKEEKE